MFSTPIHVIDFEGSRQSGIVEYGVVTLLEDRIEATHTRLCAPVGKISARDRIQHGISESLAGAECPFADEWLLFAEFRESGLLCAHNAAVEEGLIRAVWPYSREAPDFLEKGQLTTTWGPWVDTLYLYRRVYPDLESYKLADLITIFQLEAELEEVTQVHCPADRNHYHCALYDALASALLLRRLYQEPELETMSLRWLLVNSAASESSRGAMSQQDLF